MESPAGQPTPFAVASVRHFNRFYTRQIGVLQEGLLSSPFSLTALRVLYDPAHRHKPAAVEICQDLGLDAGYLSRMLRSFEKQGLIFREPSPTDGRRSHLGLTVKGQKVFSPLEKRSNQQVASMLGALSPLREKRLLAAM